MPAAEPKSGEPIHFGKYQLLERLGRGGMAEVWKARITGPAGFSRIIVIKRILPQLAEDPAFVDMFVSEARLSARLNHANIVTVFELAMFEGEYYLAMEYVRGHDLMSVLRTHSPRGVPSPGFGAYVLREVARGLGYAHALTDEAGNPLQLIHRDLSPSNLMIGFDGAVKLLDFGIAKALSEANDSLTQAGSLKGKLGYMSPEQVDGGDLDHRADLFSLGVLLHECLSGRRLFKGVHDMQTVAMVRQMKIAAPSTLNREVPPELDEICLKALARNPDERYQSGEELAAALDRVVHQFDWGTERMVTLMRSLFPEEISHTPTRTRPSSPSRPTVPEVPEESLRIPRRRRPWLYVLTAALFVGAAGGVWLGLGASHHSIEEVSRAADAPEKTPVVRPFVPPVAQPMASAAPAVPPEMVAPEVVAHERAPSTHRPTLASHEVALPRPPVAVNPPEPKLPEAKPPEAKPPEAKPEAKPHENLLKGDFVDPFEGK
jgi:serine/threonine protein kinase